MNAPEVIPFTPDWPEPLARYLRDVQPPAPALPLHDVLGPKLAQWVLDAADAKGAPADYVFAGLLAMAGATIGNALGVALEGLEGAAPDLVDDHRLTKLE